MGFLYNTLNLHIIFNIMTSGTAFAVYFSNRFQAEDSRYEHEKQQEGLYGH
jgi:hypothetical protein